MRVLILSLLFATAAHADAILPGPPPAAATGNHGRGEIRMKHPPIRFGAPGGSNAGLRAPAQWLAPCMGAMQMARRELERRGSASLSVKMSADAETVTLESRCLDDGRPHPGCDTFWAMVSVYDAKHETPFEWSNHKNGAQTSAWDLRRRGSYLEGWVEVTGDGGRAAIPILQGAVDVCLTLGKEVHVVDGDW
jgi:hypothetical protein